MPFFGTTSRTPQVTEHLCDNRITRSYKAQKDNTMNSITCCFQQVILWSTAIWPLLKSRHRRFLIFPDNHAKLSDKGPAGPKNLTQISKNIQSDATACRVRLEEKMSKCWTKEIGPGVDGLNRRRVFMRVLWRLTIGHEPTLGQGNPFWIKAGLIYGMKILNMTDGWRMREITLGPLELASQPASGSIPNGGHRWRSRPLRKDKRIEGQHERALSSSCCHPCVGDCIDRGDTKNKLLQLPDCDIKVRMLWHWRTVVGLAPTEQNNIPKEHTNVHQQRFDGVIDTALKKPSVLPSEEVGPRGIFSWMRWQIIGPHWIWETASLEDDLDGFSGTRCAAS